MQIKSRLPVVVTLTAILLFVSSSVWSRWLPFRLVKNYSVSERPGLYIVTQWKAPKKGDLVLVSFPEAAKELAKRRSWLHEGIPLLKRIVGVESDRVCHENGELTINGREIAPILAVDRQGEEMEVVNGCYTIQPGYFLPVNTYSPYSFDGRYFGPIPRDLILGKASSLLTF